MAVRRRPFKLSEAETAAPGCHLPRSGTFYGLVRPACDPTRFAEERGCVASSPGQVTCEACKALAPASLFTTAPDMPLWGPWDLETEWVFGDIPLGSKR
jgi:hypothetical protein